jgi:hypothetical protein
MLLEEARKRTTIFPREFNIKPRVTLVGKTTLVASLYPWSPDQWQIKEYNSCRLVLMAATLFFKMPLVGTKSVE